MLARMMWPSIYVALGTLAAAIVSAQGLGEVLTLDEALRTALQANRTLKSAEIETRKFDDRLAALRARQFPEFSVSALGAQRVTALNFHFDKGSLGLLPGVGPVPAEDVSIRSSPQISMLLMGQIAQPLSQQIKIRRNRHLLRLGVELAREQERSQRHLVVNQVKRAYYGILQMQSALAAVEESIALYKELDRLTDAYVAQQTALKGQSLQVKTRLAKAEYDALALRNPLASQMEQLNSLMGRDIRTDFRVQDVPEMTWQEMELEAARKRGLDQRPEVREARIRVRQAEQDRRVKQADSIPDVGVAFRYISPLNYGKLIPANIAVVGLQFEWEPFDWGRKKAELAEKDKTIAQAGIGVRETESQVMVDVGNRFRKLGESRKLLDVARLGQETARENLRVVTNRYREQASLLKDVLEVQTALADANHQYQQAVLGFWTAKADFEKALGEDQ